MSSAGRSRWMLEEVGAAYEYVHVDPLADASRRTELVRINPGGKIPAIDDDGFFLYESVAINHYLADKFAAGMLGNDLRERALVQQWTLWAMTNLQPYPLAVMLNTAILPEPQRDPAAAQAAREKAGPLLRLLEQSLNGKQFLVGERFTLADLNVGSIGFLARFAGLLTDHPSTAAWLDGLAARPAYVRANAR
jgi:glutathione S-transferase